MRLRVTLRDSPHTLDSPWLVDSELRRLKSFASAKRRQQFLTGRWLLRELLAAESGGVLEAQVAEIDVEGRTHLALGHANVSHSGDWCGAVSAARAIGVDLEVLRPRADLIGLAQEVCSPTQCEALAALEDEARLPQFYRLWTLKEAWLKARGRGLDMACMRGLEFESCPADEADSCSALLPRAGLMLSLHTQAIEPSGLPAELADEAVAWEFFRSVS